MVTVGLDCCDFRRQLFYLPIQAPHLSAKLVRGYAKRVFSIRAIHKPTYGIARKVRQAASTFK